LYKVKRFVKVFSTFFAWPVVCIVNINNYSHGRWAQCLCGLRGRGPARQPPARSMTGLRADGQLKV